MTVLGSPGVKGRYLGSEPESSDGVHQVFVVFTKVTIYGEGLHARSAKGHHLWAACPGWGCQKPPKVTVYGERHARGTKGPHLWGARPGWGYLKPPKVTIYGEGCQRNGTGKSGGQRSLFGVGTERFG